MRKNLDLTNGLIVAEAVMMGLAPHIGRQEAHDVVYDACRMVNEKGRRLADVLTAMPTCRSRLDPKVIERLTDPANYLGMAPQMVDRVLASSAKLWAHSIPPTPDERQPHGGAFGATMSSRTRGFHVVHRLSPLKHRVSAAVPILVLAGLWLVPAPHRSEPAGMAHVRDFRGDDLRHPDPAACRPGAVMIIALMRGDLHQHPDRGQGAVRLRQRHRRG